MVDLSNTVICSMLCKKTNKISFFGIFLYADCISVINFFLRKVTILCCTQYFKKIHVRPSKAVFWLQP